MVIIDIIYYDLSEAKVLLEQYYNVQTDEDVKLEFLVALDKFKSSKTNQYALTFFDSLYNENIHQINHSYLIDLSNILIELGDFSRINRIIEIVNSIEIKNYLSYSQLLANLLNINEYFDWAKSKLENEILNIHSNNKSKSYALFYYINHFNLASIPLLKNIAQNDPDENIRLNAIRKLILLDKSKETQRFIINLIPSEKDTLINRNWFADFLIDSVGTTYIYNELSKLDELEIIDADFELWAFKPLNSSPNKICESLDTLTSYTNQSYGYEWLKDVNYKDELLLKVNNAQIYLTSGDSLNCKKEIETFQNSIAEVYVDSTKSYPKYVSTAAYRFLYYQAQYILDRLQIKQIVGKNEY